MEITNYGGKKESEEQNEPIHVQGWRNDETEIRKLCRRRLDDLIRMVYGAT